MDKTCFETVLLKSGTPQYEFAHTHACMHMHVHAHTERYTCTHTHRYTCTHTHMHRYTCTHTHRYTCTHTHTHTHTDIHAHTHTCKHACMHKHYLCLYTSWLFHRPKIGCFSCSLAELFLAPPPPPPPPAAVESRSVPAVVSTSWLLLIFNLWLLSVF